MMTITSNSQQSALRQQVPISQQPQLFPDAWLQSLMSREHRPNILVQCLEASVATTAAEMAVLCVHPFRGCRVPGAISLPGRNDSNGTLLIADVSKLTLQQQINLWDWTTIRNRGMQIVSITSVPLLPLVEDGRFLEALFYRLNMVYLMTPQQSGPAD